jgi:hypothetical protein
LALIDLIESAFAPTDNIDEVAFWPRAADLDDDQQARDGPQTYSGPVTLMRSTLVHDPGYLFPIMR